MKKTILTIIIVITIIVISIPAIWLTGVYISEMKMQETKIRYEKQATININAYIKEKYPDMEFTVKELTRQV